jgi:preprotein translocase subunit YajC
LFPDSIAGPIVVLVMGVAFVGAGVFVAIRTQKKRARASIAPR